MPYADGIALPGFDARAIPGWKIFLSEGRQIVVGSDPRFDGLPVRKDPEDARTEVRKRREVQQRHDAHEEIGEVPGKLKAHDRAQKHHADHGEAKHEVYGSGFRDGAQRHVAVEKVADDARQGKSADNGKKPRSAPVAQARAQHRLHELDARFAACGPRGIQQHDEGRGSADHEGVDVDACGLHDALLDRVTALGGGRGIGHRALAGFV